MKLAVAVAQMSNVAFASSVLTIVDVASLICCTSSMASQTLPFPPDNWSANVRAPISNLIANVSALRPLVAGRQLRFTAGPTWVLERLWEMLHVFLAAFDHCARINSTEVSYIVWLAEFDCLVAEHGFICRSLRPSSPSFARGYIDLAAPRPSAITVMQATALMESIVPLFPRGVEQIRLNPESTDYTSYRVALPPGVYFGNVSIYIDNAWPASRGRHPTPLQSANAWLADAMRALLNWPHTGASESEEEHAQLADDIDPIDHLITS